MVLPYFPYPPDSGGKTRSLNVIKYLSERDDIYLVSFVRGGEEARDREALRPYCQEIHVLRNKPWSPWTALRHLRRKVLGLHAHDSELWSPWRVLKHLFSNRSFHEEVYWSTSPGKFLQGLVQSRYIDLVHLECFPLGKYLKFLPEGRRFLLEPAIEYWIFERYRAVARNPLLRLLLWLEVRRVKKSEQSVWRQADFCGTVSEVEREEILRIVPRKAVSVIPNGANCPLEGVDPAGGVARQVLFTGNFRFFANSDAAFYLCQEIFPRVRRCIPEADLLLLGTGAAQKLKKLNSYPSVKIVDWVPDFTPYLRSAAVYVCPLRIGSGTKLKVLEAMAMGKAVVSSSVGAEGFRVRNGEHMLIADDPSLFASYVCQLLADNELRSRLGRAAYELVKAEHSWKQIADKLHCAYLSMIK